MATCVGAAGEGAMKWQSNRLLLSTTQRERMTRVTKGAMSNGWSGVAVARWRLSPHEVTLTHVSAYYDQLGQYIPIVYIYIVLGPMSSRAQCSRTSRPPRAGPTNKADERADRRQPEQTEGGQRWTEDGLRTVANQRRAVGGRCWRLVGSGRSLQCTDTCYFRTGRDL
jgi:hypothetical protein